MLYENTRQCGGAGSSSSSRCRVFPGTEASAGNRRPLRRQPFQCEPLETGVEEGRRGCFGRKATPRRCVQTIPETETRVGRYSVGGADCRRVSHRLVDLCTRCGSSSQAISRAVQPRPPITNSPRSRIQSAEAATSCQRTRFRRRPAMASRRLASDQKKAKRRGATIVFIDETGFRLQPVNRRTWAPSGKTPVQRAWDRYDRLSVIGGVALSPLRSRISTPIQIHEDNIRTDEVVDFIRQLRRQFRRPLIICLDRWSVHRSAAKQVAASRLKHIEFEWLPAYAPELNPTEALWSHTKYADLANFVPDDVRHLKRSVRSSLKRQAQSHSLKESYFKTAQLKL